MRDVWMLKFSGMLVLILHIGPAWSQKVGTALPYRCGFVLESEAAIAKVYGPELGILRLEAGDVVADVGGSNGYRMAMFATLHDSIDFYIQDIDTLCLNAREFEAVERYYSKMNGDPLACTFHLVQGTPSATLLPDGIFDKVLVTASYHHFSARQAMMQDIRQKLNPSGRIYLIENVVRKTGQHRRRLCDDPLWTVADLEEEFEQQGFVVEAVHPLGRWWTKMFVLRPGRP